MLPRRNEAQRFTALVPQAWLQWGKKKAMQHPRFRGAILGGRIPNDATERRFQFG